MLILLAVRIDTTWIIFNNCAYQYVFLFIEPISCISSTQDNMCTLVSCTDNTLKLMDKQKGELLNEYDTWNLINGLSQNM